MLRKRNATLIEVCIPFILAPTIHILAICAILMNMIELNDGYE